MAAGHVVVEPRLALVLAKALRALEERRLACAANIVVLHPPNTATLEVATLRERGGEREGGGRGKGRETEGERERESAIYKHICVFKSKIRFIC